MTDDPLGFSEQRFSTIRLHYQLPDQLSVMSIQTIRGHVTVYIHTENATLILQTMYTKQQRE